MSHMGPKSTGISDLPQEILIEILEKLDMLSLCQASKVSKEWNQSASSNLLWRRNIAENFPALSNASASNTNFKSDFANAFRHANSSNIISATKYCASVGYLPGLQKSLSKIGILRAKEKDYLLTNALRKAIKNGHYHIIKYLVDHFFTQISSDNQFLITTTAIRAGNFDLVKILKEKLDPHVEIITLASVAAISEQITILAYLLEKEEGEVRAEIEKRNVNALQYLLETQNINMQPYHYDLMLVRAASYNKVDILKYLINSRRGCTSTFIHSALQQTIIKDYPEAFKLLIESRFLTKEEKNDAIVYAAEEGSIKIIQNLMDPNRSFEDFEEIFIAAAENGHLKILQLNCFEQMLKNKTFLEEAIEKCKANLQQVSNRPPHMLTQVNYGSKNISSHMLEYEQKKIEMQKQKINGVVAYLEGVICSEVKKSKAVAK